MTAALPGLILLASCGLFDGGPVVPPDGQVDGGDDSADTYDPAAEEGNDADVDPPVEDVGPGDPQPDGPCTSNADCADDDPCTEEYCETEQGLCLYPLRDGDDDGYADRECGGPDCQDGDRDINPGVMENCADEIDNDCDAYPDCLDAQCIGSDYCPCASAEVYCDDGNDEDCDGAVDCEDSQCDVACACGGELCPDGQTCCSVGCCNTLSDPDCCGGCGNPCPPDVNGCSGGVCVECAADSDCFDGNPCTQDRCNDISTCSNPAMPDNTTCPGGICCGGVCRAEGNCCTDTDCGSGCTGIARDCEEFTDLTLCSSQTGCTPSSSASCSGSAPNCSAFTDRIECTSCGCSWSDRTSDCIGSSYGCGTIHTQAICTLCTCTWSACTGTHAACDTQTMPDLCTQQRDCSWSEDGRCEGYTCR